MNARNYAILDVCNENDRNYFPEYLIFDNLLRDINSFL